MSVKTAVNWPTFVRFYRPPFSRSIRPRCSWLICVPSGKPRPRHSGRPTKQNVRTAIAMMGIKTISAWPLASGWISGSPSCCPTIPPSDNRRFGNGSTPFVEKRRRFVRGVPACEQKRRRPTAIRINGDGRCSPLSATGPPPGMNEAGLPQDRRFTKSPGRILCAYDGEPIFPRKLGVRSIVERWEEYVHPIASNRGVTDDAGTAFWNTPNESRSTTIALLLT